MAGGSCCAARKRGREPFRFVRSWHEDGETVLAIAGSGWGLFPVLLLRSTGRVGPIALESRSRRRGEERAGPLLRPGLVPDWIVAMDAGFVLEALRALARFALGIGEADDGAFGLLQLDQRLREERNRSRDSDEGSKDGEKQPACRWQSERPRDGGCILSGVPCRESNFRQPRHATYGSGRTC